MPTLHSHIGISLDGYTSGPEQSLDEPLGKGGEDLHQWAFELASWRDAHGREGGETNPSSAVVDEGLARVGATIMGRHMYSAGRGSWEDDPKPNGWWGDDPPFHHPVFVLTHHEREPQEMEGGTTFHYVTNGIESAYEQAQGAAGEQDVHVAGGADTVRQYLNAGLLKELELQVVPMLLGGGERLLEGVDPGLKLECTRVVEAPGVTHLRYRVG